MSDLSSPENTATLAKREKQKRLLIIVLVIATFIFVGFMILMAVMLKTEGG
jgi:flagellar basal body-associated protein FliL